MAGEYLYDRRARLVISAPVATPSDFTHVTTDQIEISGSSDPAAPGLRFAFKVVKTAEKDPNTAEITVTNLSEKTRGLLQQKGVKVLLEAGYKGPGVARIFLGDARSIDHIRDRADWHTKIKAGDGERGYRYARLDESFAPGVGAGTIMRRLADASGLAVGNVPAQAADLLTTFQNGYLVRGRVMDSLAKLAKSIGWTVSVQDGSLQVLPPGVAFGPEIPDITDVSGLIGSPEMGTAEKKGKPALLKFRCLLRPLIVGGRVHLKSKRYDGTLQIRKVEMTGDTHGADWYCDVHGVIHGQ